MKAPDLNLLVTLEVLIAERNVSKAAARLHLSQPAVSAQLKRLRALIGDPLLIPGHRGMLPTAKALALIETLKPALDELRASLASHRDFDPARAAFTAVIACSDYTQAVLVGPLIRRLRKTAPGIHLAIRSLDPAGAEKAMESGAVDLIFATPELAPQSLQSRLLFHDDYVLILRQRHPALRHALTLERYAALEHVIVSPSGGAFATPVDEALAARGLKRNIVLSAASFLSVPQLVASSDFAALVPSRLVQASAGRLALRKPPLPVLGFDIRMVWHGRNHGHPAQRWLRDTIVDIAKA